MGLELGMPFARQLERLQHAQLILADFGRLVLIGRLGRARRCHLAGVECLELDQIRPCLGCCVDEVDGEVAPPVVVHSRLGDDPDGSGAGTCGKFGHCDMSKS